MALRVIKIQIFESSFHSFIISLQEECSEESKQHKKKNKIYREKSIPMIALWCPTFSNQSWLTFSCMKHNILLQLLF